ncbi:MAG: hypothetical protein GF421_08490 [Candidatus Aminicenantes bacterium]|nr:hypothetical protein [Candidatus Aminicenantes bacterium]
MKKTTWFVILAFLWASPAISLTAQEQTKQEMDEKPDFQQIQRKIYTYDPAGRRDPFRDLLAGSEVEEEQGTKTVSEMSIDDINLIGIIKIKTNLTGIIRGPQGFPYKIHDGDKFKDGFVLTIDEKKVIFRKTKNRGIPLSKPINVTKEINPEER